MKLSVIFDDKQHTITWDKDLSDFPQVVQYDSKYWQWISWDRDKDGNVDQVLYFGPIKESALPVNMFGVMFPVPDFVQMFQIDTNDAPCDCGAKFTSFPSHHMLKCPKWRKF